MRDWANTGMNALLVSTLSGYFSASGIKDKFLDDLVDKIDTDDFTGETPEEEEDNRNAGKHIVRMEDIY